MLKIAREIFKLLKYPVSSIFLGYIGMVMSQELHLWTQSGLV